MNGACEESHACGLCCTKIEHFSVRIGRHEILRDVNLHFHCGEVTAVIGPNGAGKTTLLRAILGDIPHEGSVSFVDHRGLHTGHPRIGYVPQSLNFDRAAPITVLDLFTAARGGPAIPFAGRRRIRDEALSQLSLVGAEHLLRRSIGALSGGELQRVLLALALYPMPDILLLDEPVSGVDYHGIELFYQLVSELMARYALSIVLVSHDIHLVMKHATRIILLNRTVEFSGTPKEFAARGIALTAREEA